MRKLGKDLVRDVIFSRACGFLATKKSDSQSLDGGRLVEGLVVRCSQFPPWSSSECSSSSKAVVRLLKLLLLTNSCQSSPCSLPTGKTTCPETTTWRCWQRSPQSVHISAQAVEFHGQFGIAHRKSQFKKYSQFERTF